MAGARNGISFPTVACRAQPNAALDANLLPVVRGRRYGGRSCCGASAIFSRAGTTTLPCTHMGTLSLPDQPSWPGIFVFDRPALLTLQVPGRTPMPTYKAP